MNRSSTEARGRCGGQGAEQPADAARRRLLQGLAASTAGLATGAAARTASGAAALQWCTQEFAPSTLTLRERLAEMSFLADVAAPMRDMRIFVLSEDTPTHRYEQRVLARAFTEITGVQVVHEIAREGEVVNRLQQQRRSGRNFYDAYVNDADFIGTHFRSGGVVPISDLMAGEGADATLPTLDIDDLFGAPFATAPDGKLYQLPDQQFASLYWFRHDWFQRPDLRGAFAARHGYPLGVPLNWRAYEDIADFFTNVVGEIDGRRVWGHMDYGARDASLGWRFTDAWLAVAGALDPPGKIGPSVGDWGIRSDNCVAKGASVARGGATNSPAAVYALRKYLEWLTRFAPPEAAEMAFEDASRFAADGAIAQQISWYSAFVADFARPGSPVTDGRGDALWRVAPTPLGAYWRPPMRRGYQDCGAWTFLRATPADRRRAAWLYAQFCVCKSVSLKKTLVGFAPIRDSDLRHEALSAAAPRLGGLVEFYRSPIRDQFRPTGDKVPDYALLSQFWWQAIAAARAGRVTPAEAMDALAAKLDETLGRLGASGQLARCAPALGDASSPEAWMMDGSAPFAPRAEDDVVGRTIAYEEMISGWL